MSPEERRGALLAESVVALLCLCLLSVLTLGALARTSAVLGRLERRSTWVQAARTARVVLGEELGAGVRGRDWRVHPPDSIRLRAFRGWATVCDTSPSDAGLTVTVDARLQRRPEPVKDSVLALFDDGGWRVAAVTGAAFLDAGCAVGMTGESWALAPGEPWTDPPVLLRLFETGSYHLADRALRYRRGAGGRQPLTEEVLPDGRLATDGPGLAVWLGRPSGQGPEWVLRPGGP